MKFTKEISGVSGGFDRKTSDPPDHPGPVSGGFRGSSRVVCFVLFVHTPSNNTDPDLFDQYAGFKLNLALIFVLECNGPKKAPNPGRKILPFAL